ncbi:MAG: hypothetical protein LBT01_08480 [Spirochaetaceae bacterium]|nr:hypothetical protein [Spirochaetaceae bacterium]
MIFNFNALALSEKPSPLELREDVPRRVAGRAGKVWGKAISVSGTSANAPALAAIHVTAHATVRLHR